MVNIIGITKELEIWNDKLNAIVEKYLNSPWMGALLFLVLFVIGYCAVSAFSKK